MKFKYTLVLLFGLFWLQLNSQKIVEINFINANRLFTTEKLGPDIKVFAGEVCFQQDSSYFYCDSALYNTSKKTIEAFGNIMIQRLHNYDTIFIFADTLHYNGNTKVAQLRRNVRMIQDSSELTTNYFDYNTEKKYGKYFNYGRIISGTDTLYSKIGYYYTNPKTVFFKDNVKIYSKKNKIFTDTLEHNLNKKLSFLKGPTHIISDTTDIYAENGFYDHEENMGYLSKRTKIVNGHHSLEGDSLYYNKKKKFGQAFGNVTIIDTIETLYLKGEYGEYHEEGQRSLITKNALLMDIVDKDTLWLHADTLYSYIDTLRDIFDTIPFRLIFAYNHVKAFKNDLQLKCDSVVISQLDSVFMLFGSPIIWSNNQQLYGDYIELYMSKNDPKEMYLVDNTFVGEKIDSINFNIIKASNVKVIFKNRYVSTSIEMGNVETIYFLQDDADSSLIGIGKLTCDTMNIYFDKNKIQMLAPYIKPKGKIYPPKDLPQDQRKIEGFKWFEAIRPKKKEDIFIWQ